MYIRQLGNLGDSVITNRYSTVANGDFGDKCGLLYMWKSTEQKVTVTKVDPCSAMMGLTSLVTLSSTHTHAHTHTCTHKHKQTQNAIHACT